MLTTEKKILPLEEQIKRNVQERFWKGHDLRLARQVVIFPGEEIVPLVIPPEALPSFADIPQPLDFLKRTIVTGRSRYAQLGLFPDPRMGTHIALNIPADIRLSSGRFTAPFEARVIMNNLGARPIQLEAGSKLCRLFSSEATEHISGRELVEMVAEKEIGISGTYGDDWKWVYKNGRKAENKITGVALRISPASMRWIPPSPEPIHISDTSRNFRREIDQYLKPLPDKTDEPILIIGETSSVVSLSPNVHGVLDRKVLPRTESRRTIYPVFSDPVHEQSLLAEGFRTNWPIRTETRSLVDPYHIADYVILRFWRDRPAPSGLK